MLPSWIESFVKSGYAHYCTLLPTAFQDEDATVGQVAAMLGFLFSMEGLALSLGCDRTQLELAVGQSRPEDPSKTALLWAAQVQLGTLSRGELRARCDALLADPLVVPAYPRYLSGFVHALEPVPGLADVVVEAVSNAFGRLPDAVLLPWLPLLVTTLRSNAAELAPLLIREAGRIFPGRLAALDAWVPPWRTPPRSHRAPAGRSPPATHRAVRPCCRPIPRPATRWRSCWAARRDGRTRAARWTRPTRPASRCSQRTRRPATRWPTCSAATTGGPRTAAGKPWVPC
ncbi:hypothetical protein STENM327S_05206 [Streptomyces tendae]